MKIIQSVFLILFIPSIFIGQTKSIQHKVYFEKNKFEISEKTENEIDSIIELYQTNLGFQIIHNFYLEN